MRIVDFYSNLFPVKLLFKFKNSILLLIALLVMVQAKAETSNDELFLNINCPFTMVIDCSESTDPSNTGTATANGDCNLPPVITFSDFSSQGTAFCPQYSYFITRTWTATDPCGNEISCNQLIQVIDIVAPAIICPPNVTIQCDDNQNPALNPDLGVATSSGDNCSSLDEIDIYFVDMNDQIFNGCNAYNYTITRTWYASDICGNMNSCTQLITVEDTTPPTITCPPTVGVSCDASTDPTNTGFASATDNCDPFVPTTFTDVLTSSGTGCSQSTITRTWTAPDDCGNTSSCVQTINISDTTPPLFVCPPNSIAELTCFDALPQAATNVAELIAQGATVSDNCSANEDLTVIATHSNNGGNFCPGNGYIVERTYIVIDECNNASTCIQTFVFADSDTGPVITNIAPTCYKYCSSMLNPDPSDIEYTLDCNLDATVTISDPVVTGIPDCPNTSYTYTYTVTDDCGRSASAQRTLIIGNDEPTISCPPFNLILNCGDPNNDMYIATHLSQATANSSCYLEVNISNNYSPSGGVNCATPNVVTITATDACGRSVSCETTITILDNTPPVITAVPPPVCDETECNDDSDYWFNHWIDYMETGLAAEDECSNISWSTIPAVPVLNEDCDANGNATTLVTWVATDQCGNSTTVTENFVVKNEFPASFINVPADQTISCEDTAVFGPAPTVVHTCETTVTSADATDDSNPCAIVLTRTWTATDACANLTTSVTQTITKVDSTAPEFTFVPADKTVECIEDAVFEEATASDICNSLSITYVDATSGNDCTGSITRTWTATDICSNSSTASATITYSDTQAPVASNVPADATISCEQTVVFGDDPTWDDNCDDNLITDSSDSTVPGSCPNEFVATRTWTAIDDCGNTATASQSISVVDNTAPIFTFVSPNGSVDCIDFVMFEDAMATDNCGTPTITSSDNNTGDNCSGSVTRTWTATDECGNSATASATITYNDDVPPVFTFVPVNGFVECAADVVFAEAVAADLCSALSLTSSDIMTGDNCVGSVTRTWTATDACGNYNTAVATIEYADFLPPVVSDVPPSLTINCGASLDFGPAPTFTDNCTANVTVTFVDVETPGNCATGGFIYTVERTWTGIDDCGFSATANQTITVVDNEAPVWTFVPGVLDVGCGDNQDFIEPIAEDDCGNVTMTWVETQSPGTICENGFAKDRIWTATDDCGNSTTVETTVWVNPDESAPVWTFVPGVLDVGCNDNQDFIEPIAEDDCGNVTLTWVETQSPGTICENGFAKDRVWTATDDCGNSTTVETTVWVNPDESDPVFTFVPEGDLITCDEFPPTFGEPEVEDDCGSVTLTFIDEAVGNPNGCDDGESFDYRRVWTATDDCGNTSTAKQTFWIKYQAPPGANVLGFIANENNEAIESVEVNLDGSAAGINDIYQTLDDGMYAFNALPLNNNYTLTPVLNESPLNGVSSFDLLLIAQHLLGIQSLDSPYKMIAADINASGSITTVDLLELKKLILFIDTQFQNNNSWRFVEANFVFPDAGNPFATAFPELVNINGLLADVQHDFVGVKVGDVNGNAIPNNLLGGDGRDFDGELIFDIKDQILEAGQMYEVVFHSNEFLEVLGYQYTLNFDANALLFKEVSAGSLQGLDENDFGLSLLEEGVITTSWTSNQPLSMIDGVDLFTLRFEAKTTGRLSELIEVSSRYTKAEAYSRKGGTAQVNLNDVVLRFEAEDIVNDHFELYQNQPNPFHDKTIIGFNLPEATGAVLTIYDVNGTVVEELSGDYDSGYNEEAIELKNQGRAGVYYYRLVTPKRHLTKKMVLIRL